MKNRLIKAAAASAIAAAAVFAAPAIANAYTPAPVGGSSVTVTAGGTATIAFNNFEPNESVTGTLTGENAAAGSVAFVKFAVTSTSTTKVANAAGEVAFQVTLPANATGEYTLTATGTASGSSTVTIAVPAAAGGAGGSGTLPATGGDNAALLGLWIGGGALALAGGSIAVASTVRRHRNAEAAA
ncbi:LPXTG cell wall anchor domain-containing protein [Microbacterium sp. AG238]|jgi:LPXTG-motif cell wall-anchored protein|uniref:LPXTG cell wall anchor domain-containing protein n=1 Tax=Microbacterium sp. AG238 TaxID=2183994 RepID=UPI000E729A4C|nr:LPXTG cell wall anchor domain-containing protein [Microbacterium sp. AG238]RKE65083.1 LPXTG-motif cell wall-anchored protein [Microbacterium sp. AG238]